MDINEHLSFANDFCLNRRQLLNRFGMGFGAMSLASMLGPVLGGTARADESISPLLPRQPQFPAKAKRVIHIFAPGGPSHIDTFDPKPGMVKYAGDAPTGSRIGKILPSEFKFERKGKSGIEVSELFPKIAESIDDMTVIRSMHTDFGAHELATVMMNTGSQMVRPSVGAWVLYGLGTENQNLPGFITLGSGPSGAQCWQSAFLPAAYQGTLISNVSSPSDKIIENIKSQHATLAQQRSQLDLLCRMDAMRNGPQKHEAALDARLQSFELAFRMQTEATDIFDTTKEPQHILDMYGDSEIGRRMLVARRLAENGVRFIQVWAGAWDHHEDVVGNLRKNCADVDQPIGALLKDLKQRGMLEDTLVVWCGEFGRTPTSDIHSKNKPGRDHHKDAMCAWMAGGGVKGGLAYGATDDIGGKAVEDKVHVHDMHATILHLLGFDHEKLTYHHSGRDFRLTDIYGKVVKGILA